MPGGGDELVFRYAERSESSRVRRSASSSRRCLDEIGIATDVSGVRRHAADRRHRLAVSTTCSSWGWTPFVDPDPMLSYFTCDQVTTDIDVARATTTPTGAMRTTTRSTSEQKVELDRDKRIEIVHEMLRLFYDEATYIVLLRGRRPAGLPHRPFRGLAAPAGRDRPGAVHEHVADVLQPDADRRRWRRWRRAQHGRADRDRRRRQSS